MADDAVFLRKLKPKLKARIKGELPTEDTPRAVAEPTSPTPKKRRSGGGANPLAVIGAAAGAGVALAKLIDWRGHAHPRR